MAKFVYIDETGSPTGDPTKPKHRFLQLVAAIVGESEVRGLGQSLKKVARDHAGVLVGQFEFHGVEVWHGQNLWSGQTPPELLAAYKAVIDLLDLHDVDLAHATIDRLELHRKYDGGADHNAYRLALQFLLQKVHQNIAGLKIVIADESKEQELKAMRMVADLQEWGGGVVPGPAMPTIIDSLHYVRSHASPGVQMADMVAYLLHRRRLRATESHPEAQSARQSMLGTIGDHTQTWRERWPWP